MTLELIKVSLKLEIARGVTNVRVDLDANGDVRAVGWDERDTNGDRDLTVKVSPRKWRPLCRT